MGKKIMKNMWAGLLTMVMLAGLFCGSKAAEASSTIGSTPTSGSLTITRKDGDNPLAGAVYTVYKIMDLTPGTEPGEYARYSIVDHYSGVLDGVKPDMLGNFTAAEIEAKTGEILALTGTDNTGKVMPVTSIEGKTFLENLELGYYIVVETMVPQGYIAGKPFFVAIPSTSNYDGESAGTGWIYEITAEPKNAEIPLDKNIVKGQGDDGKEIFGITDTAAAGDDIHFVVDTMIPEFADIYFESDKVPVFRLTDTMSDSLEFNDDIKVYRKGNDGAETEVLPGIGTWSVQTEDIKEDFVITFAKEFLKENRGTFLRLRYSAVLTDSAAAGAQEPKNVNYVELHYSNDPGNITEYEKLDDETRVYTFGIEIEKFAKIDGINAVLPGAQFGLYKDEDCTIPACDPETLPVNSSGTVLFAGLDAGTYYLKEVQSPDGYKLLANPIKVELTGTTGDDGELDGGLEVSVDGKPIAESDNKFVTRIDTTAGKAVIAVENQKGFTIPPTGGMGVMPFLLIGIGGVVLLSIVLIKKRRA